MLLAYTVRFLAVGIANIAPGLAAIDPAMDASARMLGARPREVLRRIHLPLLRGPVLTAAIVAFVEVMKELPATLLIRPFNLDTLAVGVYRFASDERLAQAAVGADRDRRRLAGPGDPAQPRDRRHRPGPAAYFQPARSMILSASALFCAKTRALSWSSLKVPSDFSSADSSTPATTGYSELPSAK